MINDDPHSGGAAAESQSDVPANASGGWNIPGDLVAAGIEKCPADCREDLRFAYEYAHTQGWTMREAAEKFTVDVSVLSRLLNGKYVNQHKQNLPPPTAMLSIVRQIRAELAEIAHKKTTRIPTPTVQDGHLLCDKLRRDHTIGWLYGPSHLGKTELALWYRDEHNHGQTVYVDVQDCNGVQDVWRAFARALHLSADCPAYKLIPRVYKALKPDGVARSNRFVIVDEFHALTYTYLKGSSVRIINVLKSIHDKTGCAMLIIATPVAREEIESGKERKFLQQIKRRGVLEYNLPDAIPVCDVRAFAEHYGLALPTAQQVAERCAKHVGITFKPDEVADDGWKNLLTAYPEASHLAVLEDIAWNHGVKRLLCTFDDALKLAKNARREVRWADFEKASRIYTKFKTPKKV